ncbi:MAG: S8 family serine peptidase, partial [Chloroflexales bacterium]|nr:S8 family serine peptidase [Chloroflexales bacterium]
QDNNEHQVAGKETDTAGYYLYPAAVVGVYPLHQQTVLPPQIECKDQKLTRYNQYEERSLQDWGVTVAVIDSGLLPMESAGDWKYHNSVTGTLFVESGGRCLVYRDFLPRTADNGNNGAAALNSAEQHGHGAHIISTIADNRMAVLKPHTEAGPIGIAPRVNLMVARELDKRGACAYSDVIAAVAGPYRADPLNQAVMRAWQAGIVIVVSAGNSGPAAGTITVPGNIPYVITVGALTSGRYTQSGSDELARYSSRGPTESAFVKPDVLVPATHTIAPMPNTSTLAHIVEAGRIQKAAAVDYGVGKPSSHKYYQLSGASMAAAQVSGIVALMLQANPDLPNDQIKHRLLSTARPAIDPTTGRTIYSIWKQGAGLVYSQAAVSSNSSEKANINMNIAQNLQIFSDGRKEFHYWSNTTWDKSTDEFRLINPKIGEAIHMWDGNATSWAGGLSAWAGGLSAWAGSTGAPSTATAAAAAANMLLDNNDGAVPTHYVMAPMATH